jgi:processing peptidase subunit beta
MLLRTATRRLFATAAKPAVASSLLQPPATEVTTLSNGLRVGSESSHGEVATVGVWIDAGSRDETTENNGVAHFFEHMAFKGTRNTSQYKLEMEIENMGGHLNAYTSREQTVFYAKVFKKDVPRAMEILGDILQNANLEESAINREREVILREMEEVEKVKEEVIFDRLHETSFQGSSLGLNILGPRENISRLTKQDLQNFVKTQYTAPRFVVAGAGAVDHKQLVELADKTFGNLPKGSSKVDTITRVSTPARFTGSDLRFREDKEHLAHMAIAVESACWTSPHTFALMIMQTLLGCWDRTSGSGANMASKLCQAVAEQEAAVSVLTFNTSYKDTGLFGVYAVAEPVRLNDLSWIIMESMVRLCHKVTDEEVARARNQLKATMISQMDSASSIAEDIGRQLIVYGRRLTPAEIFARIDAVDAAAVRAAADEFINDQDLAVTAFGPIHEMPDYNYLRRRTYWLRS